MRWTFRVLVLAAVVLLAVDLARYADFGRLFHQPSNTVTVVPTETVLPPVGDIGAARADGAARLPWKTGDTARLARPMRFVPAPGGILVAEGSIDAGSAARLERVLDAKGADIRTVSIDSPGGALDDAIAMARMLRQRGIATRVEDGAICASSCPLMMAGGTARSAGPKAAIGVHQFYASANLPDDPAAALADAQMTTARITRYLSEMGIDPGLWLHALDTPPETLYTFTPAELARYRLTTRPWQTAQR